MTSIISSMETKGLLDAPAAERARALLAEGKPLEEALLGANGLSEETILRFLADAFEMPFVDSERLENSPPPKEFLTKFPVRLLLRHGVLPLEDRDGLTIVATSRISDTAGLDELRLASGKDVSPALATSAEIERTLKRMLGVGADTLQTLDAQAGELQVID